MIAFVFSESEISGLASKVLSHYSDVRVFTFEGDLGAGKTTFVKSLCQELASEDEASSPTFSLVNEYETKGGERLYHMDLYRVEAEDELLNIGFEDYIHSGSYCFVEWPEVGASYLDSYVHVQIEILAEGYRKFSFSRRNN